MNWDTLNPSKLSLHLKVGAIRSVVKHIQDTVEIQKMLAVITKIRLDINYYIFGNLVSNSLFILVFEEKKECHYVQPNLALGSCLGCDFRPVPPCSTFSSKLFDKKNVEWILELFSHVTLSEFPLFAKDTGEIKPRWLKT